MARFERPWAWWSSRLPTGPAAAARPVLPALRAARTDRALPFIALVQVLKAEKPAEPKRFETLPKA